MATTFTLCDVKEEDLYVNKTKEEKAVIRDKMVKMALERGIKPAARYYNTYPSTVRRWLRIYTEKNQK